MNIQNSTMKKQLWIGKVEVRPVKGSIILGDAVGAFVNIVTWAHNAEEYKKNADVVLRALKLFIVEVENLEPVSTRKEKAPLDDDAVDIVNRAENNPNAIIYGTFHKWQKDTA